MTKAAWRRVAAELRAVVTPAGRARYGAFSIEGLRLFERALAAGTPIVRALVAEGSRARPGERLERVLQDLEAAGTPIAVAPDDAVDALTGGRDLGGLLGLVPIPARPDLAALVQATERARLLVAVDVDEPGNVGALVRTALASGATAWIGVGKSDPLHPKAVRTSMGSVFRVPTIMFEHPDELLDALAGLGVETWGAVSQGGEPPWSLAPAPRTAVFVGSEAFGLSDELVGRLDHRVSIPMPGAVDSFSVNAAAAILMVELGRHGRSLDSASGL